MALATVEHICGLSGQNIGTASCPHIGISGQTGPIYIGPVVRPDIRSKRTGWRKKSCPDIGLPKSNQPRGEARGEAMGDGARPPAPVMETFSVALRT
jgi:hypothetical protein